MLSFNSWVYQIVAVGRIPESPPRAPSQRKTQPYSLSQSSSRVAVPVDVYYFQVYYYYYTSIIFVYYFHLYHTSIIFNYRAWSLLPLLLLVHSNNSFNRFLCNPCSCTWNLSGIQNNSRMMAEKTYVFSKTFSDTTQNTAQVWFLLQ